MRDAATLVIMGNGPSLKEIDLDLLRSVDCFGLNAAYRAYDRLEFWPKYFGCFDRVVSVSHMAAFVGLMEGIMPIERFFWIMPFLEHPRADVITLDRSRPDKLATMLSDFHDLGNSGANAAQVGYCLGYRRFILVGVDGRYKEELPGTKIDGNVVSVTRTPKKNPNYWFDDYQRSGDKFNVPRAETFQIPGWELLAKLAKNEGIEVLNCSPGSALECFPIVQLEEALDPGVAPWDDPAAAKSHHDLDFTKEPREIDDLDEEERLAIADPGGAPPYFSPTSDNLAEIDQSFNEEEPAEDPDDPLKIKGLVS